MQQEEKIILNPTSNKTAQMTPIVLSENSTSSVIFEVQQVDNEKNPNQKLNGKFIYTKKNLKSSSITTLNKRSVKAGESFELYLSCEETYLLCNKLNEYYKLVEDKYTPYNKTTYVKQDEDFARFRALFDDKSKLELFLKDMNLSNINTALNIENLKRVKEDIESNLENDDENFWQNLFTENSWVLSQLFNAPFVILKDKCFVGGKNISNSGGKITDFVYKNKTTNNISLIEIKTPCKELFLDSEYRDDVPKIGSDLSGGVNQLLIQKQKLNNEYLLLKNNSEEDFSAFNIDCVLIIGKVKDLNKTKLSCFENYRNELRSISIITFDEILTKIELMLALLEDENTSNDIEEEFPF